MKKNSIYFTFYLTVLCYMSFVQAQVKFSEQKVIVSHSTSTYRATSVYSADLDSDGDMDVLSSSERDNKIAWYANDGSGGFGAQQVITTAAEGAQSVYACDLDGDGDMDVLSASTPWSDWQGMIAWYENDGSGSFSEQQVITNSADGARFVYACDLDGDGDMDVLSAYNCSYGGKIAWYENLTSTDIEGNTNHPENFCLHQNYPNPFNPITIISYQLSVASEVELSVYNLRGQKVETLVSEKQNAGSYQLEWEATGLASGVYYYQIKAGNFQEVKKMVLVR